MTLNKLLPLIATIAGAAFGWLLFLWFNQVLPVPLTDLNSGAFTPSQLERRVFFALCAASGLGGAGMAWVAWRISDWAGSNRDLAALLLAAAISAAASMLGFTYMPEASRQLLWTLPLTGPIASLGASLTWWCADASSCDFS